MRPLTTAHKAQLAAKVKHVGVLVEIDYVGTPLRVWTGHHAITWDGKTWNGIGSFGGMSAITEKVGARAGSLKLTLDGVPMANKDTAQDDASQNREVKIWLATFTATAGVFSVVDAPNLIEWGETDVHEIIEAGSIDNETCTIELTVETPLARLALLSVLRCTTADQELDFPGDLGFDGAEEVAEQVLYWPNPEPQAANNAAAAASANEALTARGDILG